MHATKCDCDYLRLEVERLRDELRGLDQKAHADYQRRAEERAQRDRESAREASTWPEAFGKHAALLTNELAQARQDALKPLDEEDAKFCAEQIVCWQKSIALNQRAAELFRERWEGVEAEIRRLRMETLSGIAAQLECEGGREAESIAAALRVDEPGKLLDW